MGVRWVLCTFAILCALGCATSTPAEYLANEAAFFRTGVDRNVEEREVRRTLAQRELDVISEVRAHDFIALGAEGRDGKVTAVRVITGRGVVLAEDAAFDDLFVPGRVTLIEDFTPALGDLSLVGFTRTAAFADAGCVSLRRILPDGSVREVVLDVSAVGSRACVSSVAHAARGRIAVDVGFPSWSEGQTPLLRMELGFRTLPLGRPDPLIRVAKLVENSEQLEPERKQLSEASCAGTEFASRHALGVARAALAHFLGESTDRQVAAYRDCAGLVPAGSDAAESVADAVQHIERGFSDPAPDPDPDPDPDPE